MPLLKPLSLFVFSVRVMDQDWFLVFFPLHNCIFFFRPESVASQLRLSFG